MFQDLLIVSLRFSRCYHENSTTMKSADPILRGHPVLSGRVAHYVSNVSGYLIFTKINLHLADTKERSSVAFSGRLDSRVLCKSQPRPQRLCKSILRLLTSNCKL